MLKILGTKRLFTILFLLALNGLLAAGVYGFLIGENQNKQRELTGVRGKVASLNNDIDRLQVEFDQLEDQKAEFELLKEDGFFKDQSRRTVQDLVKLIQERSRVTKAQVSVGRGKLEENEEAKKAKHKMLTSSIDMRIEAMNDLDIFRYIFLMEEYFPGHISIQSLRFERGAEINGTVLRGIAAGQNVPLVSAQIQVAWRTMIPEEQSMGEQQ